MLGRRPTKTTRGDIGGKHDRRTTRLELCENPITFGLLPVVSRILAKNSLVSVNGERGPAVLPEELGQVIGNTLGSDEDDDLSILL
jgi:hypothetical protein